MSRLLNTPRRKLIKPPKFIMSKECKECVVYRYSSPPFLSRITVPFFGGFLGAIVVASIRYLFGIFALTYSLLNSFQLIQKFQLGRCDVGIHTRSISTFKKRKYLCNRFIDYFRCIYL